MQLPNLLDLRALNYFMVHVIKFAFVVGCCSGVLLVNEFLLSLGFSLDDFISELHGASPKVQSSCICPPRTAQYHFETV
jgi:hypothetical protein